MARRLGPAPDSWVYQISGGAFASAAGLTATVYAAASGGTLADIATYQPGAPSTPGAVITGSQLTVDANSLLPLFWFPADGSTTVYVSVAGGARTPVYANYGPRIDALEAGGDLLVNAEDYGTVGNGTTDDTTAIAAALAAAVAAAKKVYLPPGTYLHTGFSITASLHGSPLGKTILHGPQLTMSTSNVEIADLKIQATTSTAVISANCSDIRWLRVEVAHDGALSAHLAWDAFNVDRMRVLGCKFGIGGLQLSGADDFVVDGNWWDCQYLNTNEPCHISGQSSGQFVNNTVTRTATDAVDLYSSGHRCVIANNRFIGLQGAAGLECKVTMSDVPGNSSGVGNKFESTIIANNVFYDFNSSTTSTRVGIFASYVDSRAVKAFAVAETNAAIIISGNVLDGFNMTDPGNGATVSYQAIAYVGHDGIITNNIIRNMRAWNAATPVGILLSNDATGVIDGNKCVRTAIRGNTIAGVEGTVGTGIRAGHLDYCQITDNIIGTDDESGVTTKLGIDFAQGASINQCLIARNTLHCNNAAGFGIRTATTTVTLTECTISGNILRDCGMQVHKAVRCGFTDNTLTNATNAQSFTLGNSGTTCTDIQILGNRITMGGSSSGIIMTNVDGFIVSGNVFKSTTRPLYAFNTTKNGVVTNTISRTQGVGTAVLIFDASVTAPDQATTYIDPNTNKIL